MDVASFQTHVASCLGLASCKIIGFPKVKNLGYRTRSVEPGTGDPDVRLLSSFKLGRPHKLQVIGTKQVLEEKGIEVVWDQEDSYDSIRRDQQRLLDEQCIRSFRVITHLSLATASPAGRQALLEYYSLIGEVSQVNLCLKLADPPPLSSALILAAKADHMRVVDMLLEANASLEEAGPRALLAAAEFGHGAMVARFFYLLHPPGDMKAFDSGALQLCLSQGHLGMAQWLHRQGFPLPKSDTCLAEPARRGFVRTVHWLMQKGAPATSHAMAAALSLAAGAVPGDPSCGWRIVRLLIEHARDPIFSALSCLAAIRVSLRHALDLFQETNVPVNIAGGQALYLALCNSQAEEELSLLGVYMDLPLGRPGLAMICSATSDSKPESERVKYSLTENDPLAILALSSYVSLSCADEMRLRDIAKHIHTATSPSSAVMNPDQEIPLPNLLPAILRAMSELEPAQSVDWAHASRLGHKAPLIDFLPASDGLDSEKLVASSLPRPFVEAAAERFRVQLVDWLLQKGARVDMECLSPLGQACVLIALELRQQREEEANYFATIFLDATRALATWPQDIARIVIAYVLGTEGRNVANCERQRARILFPSSTLDTSSQPTLAACVPSEDAVPAYVVAGLDIRGLPFAKRAQTRSPPAVIGFELNQENRPMVQRDILNRTEEEINFQELSSREQKDDFWHTLRQGHVYKRPDY